MTALNSLDKKAIVAEMKRIAISTILILCCLSGYAGRRDRDTTYYKEPFFSTFRDLYFLAGYPANDRWDYNTFTFKFQLSLKTRPIRLSDKWGLFFEYTQVSVWNFFAESSPFRDNLYSPGIFFSWKKGDDRIYTGIEHRSNGRPYFGNKLAEEGYDDLSRGMNYLFFNWNRYIGPHAVTLEARLGFGCGVGDYEDHQKLYSQDLFLYYLGYFTAEYRYNRTHFGFHGAVTPIWNESVANVLMELEWHFREGWPWLMLQYHYGFDETMCSCVKGAKPPMDLRIGISYRFGKQ